MLIATIVASLAALASALMAWRSAVHAKDSVGESRRSANAAERSAGAAVETAEADQAENHRRTAPEFDISVEELAEHDGDRVIYRIRNRGSLDLDSVVVHRPAIGPSDGNIRHQVATTGEGEWTDAAEVGPIPVSQYSRFTLSLGSRDSLPEFCIKIVSEAHGHLPWTTTEVLGNPRKPKPPPSPVRAR